MFAQRGIYRLSCHPKESLLFLDILGDSISAADRPLCASWLGCVDLPSCWLLSSFRRLESALECSLKKEEWSDISVLGKMCMTETSPAAFSLPLATHPFQIVLSFQCFLLFVFLSKWKYFVLLILSWCLVTVRQSEDNYWCLSWAEWPLSTAVSSCRLWHLTSHCVVVSQCKGLWWAYAVSMLILNLVWSLGRKTVGGSPVHSAPSSFLLEGSTKGLLPLLLFFVLLYIINTAGWLFL